MNLDDAAHFLNVSPSTVERWVRQGLLISGDPRGRSFERVELERWARLKGIAPGAARREPQAPPEDLLAAAVRAGAVTAAVRPANALQAIELAVGAVPGIDEVARGRLLDEVLERERMASTGLGGGVALPHPRRPPAALVRAPLVSVVFPEQPLDWAALDAVPVHAVLLLLSPSAPVHLELLSRVAFALRTPEFSQFLRSRPAQGLLVERLRGLRMEG